MTTAWIAKNRTTLIVTVVVLVAAYVFYYAKNGIAPSMYTSAWGYAIPLVLAALVGVIGERSGVVNIGIEGQMLVAAFAGFFAAAYSGSLARRRARRHRQWPHPRRVPRLDHGQVADGPDHRRCRAQHRRHRHHVVLLQAGQAAPGPDAELRRADAVQIPLFGEVFFTGTSIFATLAILAALFVHFGLFHTRWGLRTRSVGEYPSAADTAGINVERLRLVNVTLAGSLAGLRRRLPVDGRLDRPSSATWSPAAGSSPWRS